MNLSWQLSKGTLKWLLYYGIKGKDDSCELSPELFGGIMKKTIAILLVAVLAAGSVFAGISGEGKIAYGYELDSKNTGFTNSTNLKVNVDLATVSEEKQVEGAIYAAAKAI